MKISFMNFYRFIISYIHMNVLLDEYIPDRLMDQDEGHVNNNGLLLLDNRSKDFKWEVRR